jgi:predicted metal-dependent hydrolase
MDSKRSWIRQALERARITEQKSIEHYSLHSSTSQAEIRRSLTSRLNELALKHNFHYNKVSLRDQKSRWASCSAHDNISLNQKLYYLPNHLRDYVLVHELAHTLEKNHSPAFWDILFKIYGNVETREMRRELKAFDFLFYPPTT